MYSGKKKKRKPGLKEINHGDITKVFNPQCIKFISYELSVPPLPACPEWVAPMAKRNLESFSLNFY